jgi:rSAM/selenodomain-associated transferase 1
MTGSVRRVVLFAREPVAGRVKTRLAREIGKGPATALYGSFLEDLAAALPHPARWDALLAHAEPEPGPFLSATFRPPWRLLPQGEGSLGERLARAVGAARENEGNDVVVVGSDAPTLSRRDLEAAFRALDDGADVVFAPAPDGGFSLVGLNGASGPWEFFESARWSTAHALEDCRGSVEAGGRRVELLEEIPDVDVLEDLETLMAIFSADPARAPASRRAIESLLERIRA